MLLKISQYSQETAVPSGLQLYQKETPTQVFSCQYCEYLTPILKNIGERLFLVIIGQLVYCQIYQRYLKVVFFDKFAVLCNCFYQILMRFRQGYCARHLLFAMIEKWKPAIDKGHNFGALPAN